jgi:hypothetical protein
MDRARQHVVNETAHALHKVLVFTSNAANPLQKWHQGRWFASWSKEAEGDYICTLFVNAQVLDHKLKPRKSKNFKWIPLPEEIREQNNTPGTDDITYLSHPQHWFTMAGRTQTMKAASEAHSPATSNSAATSTDAALLPSLDAR